MLAPAATEMRVIPNGINLSVFRPAEQATARRALKIPLDVRVLLSTGKGASRSIWRDFPVMRDATVHAARRLGGEKIILMSLGEDRDEVERFNDVEVWYVPYQTDGHAVARYYQAADLYVHASKEDTFPNSILEAMACGLAVVASNVGGISEQVKDMHSGFLVSSGSSDDMGMRIYELLVDQQKRNAMAENGCNLATQRFNRDTQAEAYLDWYGTILESRARENCLDRKAGKCLL